MSAIYKREMRAYFASLVAYIFLAAFTFIEGLLFSAYYSEGRADIYEMPFSPLFIILSLVLIPILTMRTISEDKRQKVDQVLLTAPISVGSVVMGKFLACITVFAIAYAPTLLFQIIVSYYTATNWFLYLYSLLGTMLLGAALIAIGIFVSSLTESTAISAILSIVVNIIIFFASGIAGLIGVNWITKATEYIAMTDRYVNFGESILSIPDIVYFISIIAVFLFLSVRSVEKRRWA